MASSVWENGSLWNKLLYIENPALLAAKMLRKMKQLLHVLIFFNFTCCLLTISKSDFYYKTGSNNRYFIMNSVIRNKDYIICKIHKEYIV